MNDWTTTIQKRRLNQFISYNTLSDEEAVKDKVPIYAYNLSIKREVYVEMYNKYMSGSGKQKSKAKSILVEKQMLKTTERVTLPCPVGKNKRVSVVYLQGNKEENGCH